MQNEEGKRLKLFMEREGLQQKDVGALISKEQPDVSKYISGTIKIPLRLVKAMHIKYKMSYNWFFHGTGTMKDRVLEKRNIMSDITDIQAGLGVIMASQDSMRDVLNKLVRDFYADKHLR